MPIGCALMLAYEVQRIATQVARCGGERASKATPRASTTLSDLRPGPPGMTILFVVFLLLMLIGANIFYAMVAASVAYLIASTYSTFPVPDDAGPADS